MRESLDVCCLDAYDESSSLPSFLRQLLALEGLHRGQQVQSRCRSYKRYKLYLSKGIYIYTMICINIYISISIYII